MIAEIAESTRRVEFHGCRARTAPLTWGQRGTWDAIRPWLPEMKPWFVLARWLPVPPRLTLPDVLEQLGELMRRNESLRTRYHETASGDAVQEVLPAGSVAVAVFNRPDGDPVTFTDIVTDCIARATATPIDHDHDLPVRFYVALHDGIPVLVIFGVSHMSADYIGADELAAQLTAMLRARGDGLPAPAPGDAPQPADVAAFESSPEGQLLSIEALHHLRRQLRRMPPATLPARAVPCSPRYLRGELESDAVPVAVRAAARRYRATTSTVLLSIVTALMRCVTDAPMYPLEIMQGNRAAAGMRHTVSSLNQAVRTAVDLDAESFGELVAQSAQLLVDARRHGRYDGRAADQVAAAVAAERGAPAEPACQFNDRWSILPRPTTTASATTDLQRLSETTVFGWYDRIEAEGMVMFLDTYGTAERMQVSLLADTALLGPPDIEAFLRTFEDIALAVVREDLSVTQVKAMFDARSRCTLP